MMNYTDIVEIVNKECDVKIEKYELGLHMINHKHPISITQGEFEFIGNFIVNNNLKTGFEVATAFGISALSAGLAFKQTGGKLITMDCYAEEQLSDAHSYGNKYQTYKNADGYVIANFIKEKFDIPIEIIIGWSPWDTPAAIKNVHGDKKLDYVFIDAMHTDDALIQDINGIFPFLNDKFIVFCHDMHCFSDLTLWYIQAKLNCRLQIPNISSPNYQLFCFTNI